ncbi:MAG: hypothetical protein R6U44_11215 [Archaeoglobaceae archaeon]
MMDTKSGGSSEQRYSLTKDISITFYLVASRKSNRLKKTVWIESIYYDILKEKNIIISDLVNYLLEKYLTEMEFLEPESALNELK